MKYGQLEYYIDELNQWFRMAIFHKAAMDESLRQLDLIMSFPVVSLPALKAGRALIERITSQKKKTDSFSADLKEQIKKTKQAIVDGTPEPCIYEQQKNLRFKMHKYDARFVKTSRECSAFVAGFFEVADASQENVAIR